MRSVAEKARRIDELGRKSIATRQRFTIKERRTALIEPFPQKPVTKKECEHLSTRKTGWLAPARDQFIDAQHFNSSQLAIHRSLDKSYLYFDLRVMNRGLGLLRHIIYCTAGPGFEGVREIELAGDTALVQVERFNYFYKFEAHTARARTYRKGTFLASVKTALAFVPLETARAHHTEFTPAVPLWYVDLEDPHFIWDMFEDLTVMAAIESNLLKINTKEVDEETFSFLSLMIDPYGVLDESTLCLRQSRKDMVIVPL